MKLKLCFIFVLKFSVIGLTRSFSCNCSHLSNFTKCSLARKDDFDSVGDFQKAKLMLKPEKPLQSVEIFDSRSSASYPVIKLLNDWIAPNIWNPVSFRTIIESVLGVQLIKYYVDNGKQGIELSVATNLSKTDPKFNITLILFGNWSYSKCGPGSSEIPELSSNSTTITSTDENTTDTTTSSIATTVATTSSAPIYFDKSDNDGYEDALIILIVAFFVLVIGGTFFLAGILKYRKAVRLNKGTPAKYGAYDQPDEMSLEQMERSNSVGYIPSKDKYDEDDLQSEDSADSKSGGIATVLEQQPKKACVISKSN